MRAYRRDKRNQMSDFHGDRKDSSVGRTRRWWSYMNCFDRQKYTFNRGTSQDFYSDSDSDGSKSEEDSSELSERGVFDELMKDCVTKTIVIIRHNGIFLRIYTFMGDNKR